MGPMVYGAAWWKISDRTAIQKHFKFAGKRHFISRFEESERVEKRRAIRRN